MDLLMEMPRYWWKFKGVGKSEGIIETARRLIVHAITLWRLKFSSPINYLPFLPEPLLLLFCCLLL